MSYVSSFDHYTWNIRSIGKVRTTEESLNARFFNDVKFDGIIFKLKVESVNPSRQAKTSEGLNLDMSKVYIGCNGDR